MQVDWSRIVRTVHNLDEANTWRKLHVGRRQVQRCLSDAGRVEETARLPIGGTSLRSGFQKCFPEHPGGDHRIVTRRPPAPARRPIGAVTPVISFNVDPDACPSGCRCHEGHHPRSAVRQAQCQSVTADGLRSTVGGDLDSHRIGRPTGRRREQPAREPVTEDELQPALAAHDAGQRGVLRGRETGGGRRREGRIADRRRVGQPRKRLPWTIVDQR
jgi:hypothetical protein